jgi:dTDP-glucose pyrophosphorylase
MCTALLTIDDLVKSEPVLIAGSNSLLRNELHKALNFFIEQSADVGVISFEGKGDQWSYVRVNESSRVSEITEKRKISNFATTGIFYFRSPALFLEGSSWALINNLSYKGEYFISHSISGLILKNAKVINYNLQNADNFLYETENYEKV